MSAGLVLARSDAGAELPAPAHHLRISIPTARPPKNPPVTITLFLWKRALHAIGKRGRSLQKEEGCFTVVQNALNRWGGASTPPEQKGKQSCARKEKGTEGGEEGEALIHLWGSILVITGRERRKIAARLA